VQVLELADRDRLSSDARQNAVVAERLGIGIERIDPATQLDVLEQRLQAADWIVDALLGTGLTSEVREPLRGVIEAINRASAHVIAVDLPSGLDCDRGEPLGVAIRATITATFVALKQGFLRPGADAWTGAVEVIGIGVPADLETRLRP
jgi:NAD(P)H-hydrate epimerase